MNRTFLSLAVVFSVSSIVHAIDTRDTRMLTQPACSDKHVAFVYAEDIWVADIDGKNPRRLTSDLGIEAFPVFSPDGKTIAFTGTYEGNMDVYTVPVEGGEPKRLTWHPGPDMVRGWTPDGSAILFTSPRAVFTGRFTQLFTVPINGGVETQLPIPNAADASYSADGSKIAYTPIADRSAQWKNYRGGTASRIWICKLENLAVDQIPQPDGRCNDNAPRWQDKTVYFRSDRNGEYNLFSFDGESKALKQLTNFTDFPVMGIGVGGGNIVFEQAGYLHRYDPSSGKSTKLTIPIATDLNERRPRYVKGSKYVRNAAISPSGARAVFETRGEIVTVPAEKGDPHNLTQSPGVHERDPAWSPDGKTVAYFSDAGGEYHLCLATADGKKAITHKLMGSGFYETPVWSPDSKKIVYSDNSRTLYWMNVETGECKKVAQETLYSPVKLMRYTWSPDSQWLAYNTANKASINRIFVYSLKDGKSSAITDGLSDAVEPVFDASGKYLYFLAATDAGPVNQWFSQASADVNSKRNIYLAVLAKGVPSPFVKESDEEKAPPAKKEEEKKAKDAKEPEKPVTKIDLAGIDQRILAFPLPAAGYQQLQAGPAGQVFFLKAPFFTIEDEVAGAGGELHRYDLNKRKDEKVGPEIATYLLTPDGKKMLAMIKGKGGPGPWTISDVGAPADAAKKLNLDAIELRVDPPTEWAQILHEAWRINRDYFYAPNMHGADWPAIKTKYEEFLPHLSCRSDLDRILVAMLSELAVGHSGTRPGERVNELKSIPGGLLGADYEVANGRYRFKKVFGGLNWSPDLKAPLTAPAVDVKAGDYLLAVRGIDLKPPTNLYSLFENTAGKSLELTVGPNPDGKGARTVTVEPIASESALRNRDWVEGNMRKVHKATDGRVAYVYVPNTATQGHEYFKRYFYPQADKDAIIVDERFNGGGSVADYYIDHLRKPFTCHWTTRHGEDLTSPLAIFGPKCMLIDETAGSGGDLLPWMFRQNKIGPLIGKRTWGGLVGILGFPVLMDGGRVTAPDVGFWTKEEGFGVENVGVPPDIEVEQFPAEIAAGKDPQLDKAIEWVLGELKKSPDKKDQRPAFPVRVRKAG